MLIRLTTEDISTNWALLRHTLREAHPKTIQLDEEFYSGVLTKLNLGVMQAWAGYEEGELKGMVVTEILADPYEHSNTLLIFAIYGAEPLTFEHWRKAYNDLVSFAKLCNCKTITGFTDFEAVVANAKKFGATHRHYIILEV